MKEELLMILTASPCEGGGDILRNKLVSPSIENGYKVAIKVMSSISCTPDGIRIRNGG